MGRCHFEAQLVGEAADHTGGRGAQLLEINPDRRGAGKRLVACFAATDNLVKGGAGQAIQSMNLMLGLDERLTLEDPGGWP